MFKKIISASLIGISLISSTAFADGGHYNRWHSHYHDEDRRYDNVVYARDYRYPDYYGRRYTRGQYIPAYARWYYPPNDIVYRLGPPPRRTEYVMVDRDVYVVDPVTRLIYDVINLSFR